MPVTRHRAWLRVLPLVPLLLVLLHVSGVASMGLLLRLDDLIYDARLRWDMPQTQDERIVIVDIDEQSLAEVGRWPWPRDRLAQLVDQLFEQQQVRLLGMDTVLAEPDPGGELVALARVQALPLAQDAATRAQLEALRREFDHDARLARALAARPVVLGYYFTSDRDGRRSGQLPEPVLRRSDLQGRHVTITEWNGYGANLPSLAQVAPRAGFFNAVTDRDGLVRSLPLLAAHGDEVHESLVLAMWRHLLGDPAVQLPAPDRGGSDYAGVHQLRLAREDGWLDVPVDGRAVALVPFRGNGGPKGGSFAYVSAADVLAGRLPAGALSGRMVLLGTTAPGLQDLRATPLGETYPGVEVHANLLSGLMDGRLKVRPDYAPGYEALVLLGVGLMLVLLLPRLGATGASVLGAGLLLGATGLNQWLYQAHGLVLPLAATLALVLTACALHMGLGYAREARARRQLARQFGTYVPPEIVRQMLREPDRYGMGASTHELTVMFCDMKGFTAMAERMPPQQLQALLNVVFSRLSAVVSQHQGTIDKYMGDCLMAFWGAPLPMPDHAERAVSAAQAIVSEVQAINRDHQAQGWPAIGVGVGLSTGPMCVGDMGSDIRRSYTVIGDAVNLGARLEGLSRVYGVDIVASDRTRELTPATAWQEIDRVRVKGRAQALAVHQPLGPVGALDAAAQQELSQWRAFRQAWLARDWPGCQALLDDLQALNAKKVLYRHWAQRVALARQSPPGPDWDGATDFSTK